MNAPSLLLVDEPTASLDRRRSHQVVQLLAERAHGSDVHVVSDVPEYRDRVLDMVDGRLGLPAVEG